MLKNNVSSRKNHNSTINRDIRDIKANESTRNGILGNMETIETRERKRIMKLTIEHDITVDNVISSLYFMPNGQEYMCNICGQIYYDIKHIREHCSMHTLKEIKEI